MPRTSLTSCSAGLARRIAAFRSSARPATPVPSSLRRIASRSPYGRRSAAKTRSRSTGECVCSSGTVGAPLSPFSSGGLSGVPGWHCTNFSPISDCGRIVHSASATEGREALLDVHLDARLALLREVDVAHLPDARAGDLHVLAGDQVRGRVEDRVDAVGRLGSTRAERRQRRPRRRSRRRAGRASSRVVLLVAHDVLVDERVRAVLGRLRRGARAALVDVRAEAGQALLARAGAARATRGRSAWRSSPGTRSGRSGRSRRSSRRSYRRSRSSGRRSGPGT